MSTIALIGHGLIGSQLREALVKEGYEVLVMDINKPQQDVAYIKLDINSDDSIQAAISELGKRNIKLSGLVNTSYPRTPTYGRKLEEVTLESFNQNVSAHLGGYFNVLKHFAEYFKKQGGGSIISFSSVYGVVAPRFDIYEGMPFSMPVEYAAVKSALLHLNSYFAKYYHGTDVRFNAVSPGGVFSGHDKKFVDAYGKYSLSSRAGMLMPEDLVSAVLFLCSKGSKYVNGQNIVVDDGWTL